MTRVGHLSISALVVAIAREITAVASISVDPSVKKEPSAAITVISAFGVFYTDLSTIWINGLVHWGRGR